MDRLEELKRLHKLKEEGSLTEEEFNQQKVRILGKDAPAEGQAKDDVQSPSAPASTASAPTPNVRSQTRVVEPPQEPSPQPVFTEPPNSPSEAPRNNAGKIILFVALGILILGCIGVFGFGLFVTESSQKMEALIEREQNIERKTSTSSADFAQKYQEGFVSSCAEEGRKRGMEPRAATRLCACTAKGLVTQNDQVTLRRMAKNLKSPEYARAVQRAASKCQLSDIPKRR